MRHILPFIFTLMLALPMSAHAQQPQSMEELMNNPEFKQQMEQVRKQMQQQGVDTSQFDAQMNQQASGMQLDGTIEFSTCLQENVGEDGFKRMEAKAVEFEKKIEKLCKEGKADQARQDAYAYYEAFKSSPDGQGVAKCREKYGKKMNDQMDDIYNQLGIKDEEGESKDICDGY